MGAKKGNTNWKNRKSSGRKCFFDNPSDLWDAACRYFQHVDEHPFTEIKMIESTNGSETKIEREKDMPYTLSGLCLYLGATTCWWCRMKKRHTERNNTEFVEVMQRIEETIETQQFEGAVVGVFNAGIIARKLGLTDKKAIDYSSGENGSFGLNIIIDEAINNQ